jgi:chemotaxis signal transduction protein
MSAPSASDRAAELRRAFDAGFAAPPAAQGEQPESLIALRVAGEAFAVRTRQVSGIARCTRIVPLPSEAAELLGITSLHGTLLAVYDLARLLDLSDGGDATGWLLLANPEAPVALAFAQFEGQMQVARECLNPVEGSRTRQCARQAVRLGTDLRLVIDIAEIVEIIRTGGGPHGPAREGNA